MNQKQAIKIAIDAMIELKRKYIFDANMYKMGLDNPTSSNAYKKVSKLDDAIKQLDVARKQKRMF